MDGYGYRIFQDGDDLGLIEHPRDDLAAGDLVLDPGGQLALVTAYLPADLDAPVQRRAGRPSFSFP